MGIFVGCMDETNKRKQSLDLEELPRSEEMESGGSTFSAEYNILFFFRAFPSSPHPNRDLTCQKISKMMAMEVEKKPGPEWLDLSSPASPSDRIIGIIRLFPRGNPRAMICQNWGVVCRPTPPMARMARSFLRYLSSFWGKKTTLLFISFHVHPKNIQKYES